MLNFSTDRRAGLDAVVLKITTPPQVKVSTIIHNRRHEQRTAGLPHLPSSSTLHLPSFLNFSTRPLTSTTDSPTRSTASLPPSALLGVARKARDTSGFEGPQWIPAFHHPNSPYVPWSSPVRRRILLPPSPPVCPSPCVRPGAVALEPWVSSTFSQAPNRSTKQRISSCLKRFKHSIKKRVKTVVSRLDNSKALCASQGMLSAYDGIDTVVRPNEMQSSHAELHSSDLRDSLASFVSSDSTTLAAWLAERRANASCATDDTPRVMSMEEYELVGSWLDLRHGDGGWVCGVQGCDMHTAKGSPCAANDHRNRMAIPLAPTFSFRDGPPRFHSLPRFLCRSYSAQEAKRATLTNAERCLSMLSMPGGWTFN